MNQSKKRTDSPLLDDSGKFFNLERIRKANSSLSKELMNSQHWDRLMEEKRPFLTLGHRFRWLQKWEKYSLFRKSMSLLIMTICFLLTIQVAMMIYNFPKGEPSSPIVGNITSPAPIKFPQTLHLMFPKSGSLSDPVYQAQLLLRFSRQQPNYNVVTYQYDDMLSLIEEHRPDVAGSWFQMNQEEEAQFYFWQYALLYFRGGIWMEPTLFENLVNGHAWPSVLQWLFPNSTPSSGSDSQQQGASRIPGKSMKRQEQNPPTSSFLGEKYCIFPDTFLSGENVTKHDPDLILTISSRLDLNMPAPPTALFPLMPSFLISNQLMVATTFHPVFQRAMDLIQNAPPVNPAALSYGSFSTLSELEPEDIRYGSLLLSHLLQKYLMEQQSQALPKANYSTNSSNRTGERKNSKVEATSKKKEFAIESYCLDETTVKRGNICCFSKTGLIPEQSLKSLLKKQRS